MRNYLLLLLSVFVIFSCNDDDDTAASTDVPDPVIEAPSYLPLEIGNYWIYEVSKLDTFGNVEIMSNLDTVIVVGDTIINGHLYHVIKDDLYNLSSIASTFHYRDSLGSILDLGMKNKVIFSPDDFTMPLHSIVNDVVNIQYYMEEEPVNITVPLGEFECLNFKADYALSDPDDDTPTRTRFHYYSKDVGLVYSNAFFTSNASFSFERKLVDYNVQ